MNIRAKELERAKLKKKKKKERATRDEITLSATLFLSLISATASTRRIYEIISSVVLEVYEFL